MRKKQLAVLGICNFVINAGISGLVGLMPIYLKRLGAPSTVTGGFLALIYVSLALSNLLAGWLSARFQRRKIFLICGGILAVPLAWSMSQTSAITLLLALMASLWFVTGIVLTMTNLLTGLSAEAAHRGRSFGILTLCGGFGLFLGGLVSGPIVDRWGFPALFAAFAVCYLILPTAGWFVEEQETGLDTDSPAFHYRTIFTRQTFTLLFTASILAQAANIMVFLTRPLLMDALHFNLTAISRAAAIGNLATFPLPLVLGWLTDRIGRKWIILVCFLAPALGLLVQMGAILSWQFAVSAALTSLVGISTSIGSALVTDIFSKDSLSASLSLLNATPWIGIVFGLSAGGFAISAFQIRPAMMLAVLLSLAALVLFLPVSEPGSKET